MKAPITLITALALTFSATGSFAANAECEAKAMEKKLAGAAKNSFMKKCEKDSAVAACETQASEKKLAGAAKNSFLKKCEKDATGGK